MNGIRIIAILGALLAPLAGVAQNFPTKPVRVVSTIPQGGSGDVAVRLAASKASETIGQTIIVETNGSAGGTVAARMVKAAPPDGYTLFHSSNGALAASLFTVKDLGYNPVTDFSPVTLIAKAPSFIAVATHVPGNTLKEVVEYAKKNPGKLSYGSNGVGSFFHITGETFKAAAGIDVLHVPYTGGNVSIPLNDLLAGRIDMFFPSFTLAGPHIKSGRMKLMAVMAERRLPGAPEVPTIDEAFPAYKPLPSWFALVAPLNTPRPVVLRLQGEFGKALSDKTVAGRLGDLGMIPGGGAPEEIAQIIKDTVQLSGAAVKMLGIKPQ